jgi:hypothetical protein
MGSIGVRVHDSRRLTEEPYAPKDRLGYGPQGRGREQ